VNGVSDRPARVGRAERMAYVEHVAKEPQRAQEDAEKTSTFSRLSVQFSISFTAAGSSRTSPVEITQERVQVRDAERPARPIRFDGLTIFLNLPL
jgi:hypothetical protein